MQHRSLFLFSFGRGGQSKVQTKTQCGSMQIEMRVVYQVCHTPCKQYNIVVFIVKSMTCHKSSQHTPPGSKIHVPVDASSNHPGSLWPQNGALAARAKQCGPRNPVDPAGDRIIEVCESFVSHPSHNVSVVSVAPFFFKETIFG